MCYIFMKRDDVDMCVCTVMAFAPTRSVQFSSGSERVAPVAHYYYYMTDIYELSVSVFALIIKEGGEKTDGIYTEPVQDQM